MSDLSQLKVGGSQAEEDKVRVCWLLRKVQASLIALLGVRERTLQVVAVTTESPDIH